jgi:hypothetical protein
MKSLKCGDEVAVLPHAGALPQDVLDIATIVYVGPKLIEVSDGRIYFADDGRSLHDAEHDCIVPATEEHRSALLAKLR